MNSTSFKIGHKINFGRIGCLSSAWKGGITKDRKVYQKTYWQEQRKEMIKLLGNTCIKCGFSDIRALQVDHINGGGSNERNLKN